MTTKNTIEAKVITYFSNKNIIVDADEVSAVVNTLIFMKSNASNEDIKMAYEQVKLVEEVATETKEEAMETVTVTTEAEVGIIGRTFQYVVSGIASTWKELIENKRLVIGVGNYYIAIGRTSDCSYGVELVVGDRAFTVSLKNIKEALVKAWEWIKQAWSNTKARDV